MEKRVEEDNVTFKEIFYFLEDREVKEVLLTVTPSKLIIAKPSEELSIDFRHIIGATTEKVPSSTLRNGLKGKEPGAPDSIFALKVHFHNTDKDDPKVKKLKKKTGEHICYHDNQKIVTIWRNLILHAANNQDFEAVAKKAEKPENLPAFKRTFLVFVNPKSGKGDSVKIWKTAKAYLDKAGCEFTEVMTEYHLHAKEYIQKQETSELKQFDGILSVSGDGLPHELINGIMSRPDWEEIKEIPIGPLPSGSGNALVNSLLVKANKENNLINACYMVAKGRTLRSDLTLFERADGSKVYSFLFFAWGVISYIDFQSEKLRFMGGWRFEIYAAIGLMRNLMYNGKITYSTTSQELPPLTEELTGEDWKTLQDTFSWFTIHNLPFMATNTQTAPLADFDDGYNHFLALNGRNCTRKKLITIWNNVYGTLFENGQPKSATSLFFEKVKAFRIEPGQGNPTHYYSIDGEKYPAEKIQAKVLEKAIKYFYTD